MSDGDKQQIKWLNSFRNQIIAVVASALIGGLFMNYKFMSTIELVMQSNTDNTNLKFEGVKIQFDGVNKRVDKVEDKVDGVYKSTVPENEQFEEPRVKKRNGKF